MCCCPDNAFIIKCFFGDRGKNDKMKKQLITSFFSLILIATAFSCKDKTNTDPVVDTCRMVGYTAPINSKSTFDYDANGRIIHEVRKVDNDLDGKAIGDYTYTYDANGKLTKNTYKITVDGNLLYDDTDTYTWENNKIIKATYTDGINNIKYNAKGQMVEYTFESKNDPTTNAKWTYKYDANDVLIDRILTSMDGKDAYFQFKLIYTSKEIVKTPLSYMARVGLPFDFFYSREWEVNNPKTDGTYEYYYPDADGKLVLKLKDTFKEIKLDSKGVVSQLITTNLKGETQSTNYQVSNCQ
jgi:YD repeat-containing protein